MKELQFEAPIHASDHVVHHRQAGFFRRLRILPREILIDEFGEGLGDSDRFALLLDRHFPPLKHLDGVLLEGPPVELPQVSIDADIRDQALVDDFDRTDTLLRAARHRIRRARHRRLRQWLFARQHLRRIGRRGLDDRVRLIRGH